MLLERYYDESLAQASFMIACEQSGEAIIIDPNRDVERYVRAASARRLRIRYVAETHIHADFLSGARALADAARATLVLSGLGGADWSYRYKGGENTRLVRDGESINVGKVRLNVLHTPGHTPEHIAFVVTDTVVGDLPLGIVTGDFLFVGDVGRPDLLERSAKAEGTMERGAKELYASLLRIADLPEYLQVWPGHGAGSACGKSLGSVPQSTLGYERLYNPALQHKSEGAFVRWVLADQPEPPPYFAEMKRLNRDGPPATSGSGAPPQMDAEAVAKARAEPHWIVDVRGSADFAREHLPGAINIPASNKLPTYAGTVLSFDRPIVLLAKSEDQAVSVRRQLALIGLDRVVGWGGLDVLQDVKREGGPVSFVRVIEPRVLAEQIEANGGGPRVIDVRGRPEWDDGHLPGATHIYLGDLQDRMRELRKDEPIVVQCETGSRSSIAASLLMARGFSDVTNLVGGFQAWHRLGLPVSEDR